ncbi:hypothetical protein [Cupriavidus sp. CuC1]|uniref:hypothetical protein n=1 Tax=Cupriavidus sp. CuC1 TaxID=3373131 RepID=UPI0037D19ED8
MQNKIKLTLSAFSVASLLALAACGGGGDGGGSSTPAAVTPAPPPPNIVVQGSAPTVTADPMAVVFVPQTETSTKSVLQSIASNAFPGSLQKATAEGGYKQIGIDANSLISLTTGKIVDVAGNGDFAIGRWTDGSSSIGNMSVKQGSHYAVGRPLTLKPNLSAGAPSVKASCTLLASTNPTAVSGNFAPGHVNSASATVDITLAIVDTFSLDIAIGSDTNAKVTVPFPTINGVFQSSGVMQHVQTMGADPAKPLLAIGYAMPTPSSGDVTGVVVLQCQ